MTYCENCGHKVMLQPIDSVLLCEKCGYTNCITQVSRPEDRGWNALEGKETINYNCGRCGKENIRKLAWNHNSIESCALGKLV